jgi:hypothetical protein
LVNNLGGISAARPGWKTKTQKEKTHTMPCAEFVNAIEWSKKSTNTEKYPVIAYFTLHFGTAGPSRFWSSPTTTNLNFGRKQ